VSFVPAPNQSSIQTALWNFLTNILPSGTEVILGQQNRVPEPEGGDFVIFTPIRRDRISTNIDVYADCAFTASIAGNVLDVSAIQFGVVGIGNTLFGVNIASGITILNQLTGPIGGAGTYTLSASQTVSSEVMACGIENILQPTRVVIQIDVHGPNSADNAQTISTLFRDDYGVQQFASSGFDVIPLYADDPKQVPFVNAEQQYETRWIVEAAMQANQTISGLPQQFAGELTFNPPVNVTVTYPT
jgi:hypothetical protein